MNKSMRAFLISLEFISILLFAIPTIGVFCSLLVGIIPVGIALFCVKDKIAGSKTLQPYIVLCGIALIRLVFDLLFYIIIMLSGDPNAQMAYIIIQIILLILLVIFEVIVLAFICSKQDAPAVGKWANKIVEIEQERKAKKETNNEQKEIEEIVDNDK